MANITSYPTANPTGNDLIIGTDMSTTPISTKTFTIDSINSLGGAPVGTGTINTIPIFTSSTAVGNSPMTYVTGGEYIQFFTGTTRITTNSVNVTTSISENLFTTNIQASSSGTVTIKGNTIVGDAATDVLTVNAASTFATAAVFSSSVTASSLVKSGGTASQFLMANGTTSIATFVFNTSSSTGIQSTGNTASGVNSIAMGNGTAASGGESTAMGRQTTASEDYSTAMGKSTIASGESSTAMGDNTTASGSKSIAMGNTTTASGNESTAMGNTTIAAAASSTAMGVFTTASGFASTAMGESATASGRASTAMGDNTTAFGYASTAIGRFNVLNTGDNAAAYAATNTAFSIGNGTAEAARSDAFKVLFNGTTTIAGSVTSESLNVTALNAVPASATAAGTLGSIRFTAGHIYVCVATNTWKRVAIATF